MALLPSLIIVGWSVVAMLGSEPRPDTIRTPVRVFFLSDAHSRHDHVARFVEEANRARPDLVIDGGDMVHDGTHAEFRRAFSYRSWLVSPWTGVRGNHDAHLRGPFPDGVPEFSTVHTVEHGGLRFLLLDNHGEEISEEQFRWLESELEASPGRRAVVVMHVPPFLTREPFIVRLRHLLPYRLASPVMRVPAQVERFTDLMERYDVLAVLSGHAHFPDHTVANGVHYITAGALGGLPAGLGVANEYVDILLDGRDVEVRRVRFSDPPGDPISLVVEAFRFYARLNSFNHAEQGWSYVPSASVQVRTGLAVLEARREDETVLHAAVSFERMFGERGRHSLIGDPGLYAGTRTILAELELGYRLRPVGGFNRGVHLGVGGIANAGVIAGGATAGVGARAGVGFEWHRFTSELSRTWATNHTGTLLRVGYRF